MPSHLLFGSYRRKYISVYSGLYFAWILLAFIFVSCGVKLPPKNVNIVLREYNSGQPIQDTISLISGNNTVENFVTNKLGHTEFRWKKYLPGQDSLIGKSLLKWSCSFNDEGGSFLVRDSVWVNKYLPFYDLYLVNQRSARSNILSDTSCRVADMHYHVSQRVQNLFGKWLYENGTTLPIPSNLNWYRDYQKLSILSGGKWLKHLMDTVSRNELMSAYLRQKWIYSKGGTNFLTHYTQATFPQMKEGNVYLAFNAITPWEFKLSNTWYKRFANRFFVSGAPKKWLHRIGWYKKGIGMTHWDNFNLEYDMITRQDPGVNKFGWRFFDENTNLDDHIPTIVTVVEGSHILQHHLFPHTIKYKNIRSKRAEEHYRENQLKAIAECKSDASPNTTIKNLNNINFLVNAFNLGNITDSMKQSWLTEDKPLDHVLPYISKTSIRPFVDSVHMLELTDNIDSLKRLKGPPICMMTIAHLAYNGMMGNSTSIDGGGFINHTMSKKYYNIRVSDDPSYVEQWENTFFTVPGVNAFGKAVIDSLLSRKNGHRILIDLKHSDVFTRKYFFNEVMTRLDTNSGRIDTIPPICSHCGVTGLGLNYYSPFVNEYSLLRTSFTKTFYPFAINLFDDEIKSICTHHGIIGIPLEQRIIGGYINNKSALDYFINSRGMKDDNKQQFIRRWKTVERWLYHYTVKNDIVIREPIHYTVSVMGVAENPAAKASDTLKRMKPVLNVLFRDYKSTEPFLQNVFHVIDQSGLDPKEAWRHVCIGSDLDGLIDPIDICPTASQYPVFRKRVEQLIPLFLKMRADMNPGIKYRTESDYFNEEFTIDMAMNQLFYNSLRDFTARYFLK